MKKDYVLFGTKVLNLRTKEIVLVLNTWKNKYADATVDFATCVTAKGRVYNTPLDNIEPIEE